MKISGVYSITNNVTGELYIGSSKDIEKRWNIHKTPYTIKQHPNVKLYKAMAQYGRDNFTIEVIEETDNLREREQYWIDKLKPSYNSRYAKGWNTERRKEAHKRRHKEWYKVNRDERLAKMKANYSRLCFYEGETLTLNALSAKFSYHGIPHARVEAKKYLIEKEE